MYPLVIKPDNETTTRLPFIDDCPIKTSRYSGFPTAMAAMFDCWRVFWVFFDYTDFLARDLADFIRQVDVDPDYADSLAAHAKDTALMWCGDGSKYMYIHISKQFQNIYSAVGLDHILWYVMYINGLHTLYMILGCLWECGIPQNAYFQSKP